MQLQIYNEYMFILGGYKNAQNKFDSLLEGNLGEYYFFVS